MTDLEELRKAAAKLGHPQSWRYVEREDDALISQPHWNYGASAVAIRPKLMKADEWRPTGQFIALANPQTILEMIGEIERLRRLLWDSYEFIGSERLRDPEYAHQNDRDEFRSRNKQHPILLAEIRAALAEPVKEG